jgi:hypothetical protein
MLDRTGKTFLSGILTTIKYRIERQLVEDYRAWVAASRRQAQDNTSGSLQGRPVQG